MKNKQIEILFPKNVSCIVFSISLHFYPEQYVINIRSDYNY
jgi:hypothetical protein